ncbi:hypothetical protein CI610_01753 [invertebrate metagenome]|uniref:Methyltransferase small domain-containing protein n=1 Tax=invertebrate metagenome TaxID=1711999 RepID=A0A2H9T801_9ZZZZ
MSNSVQRKDPNIWFSHLNDRQQEMPVNRSVVAQLSERPIQPGTLPNIPSPSRQPPPVQNEPVNPLVDLYRSGEMEKQIEQAKIPPATTLMSSANEENPLADLYRSGAMENMILQTEDAQYIKTVHQWEKNQSLRKLYRRTPGGMHDFPNTPPPPLPERDFETIQNQMSRGINYLRNHELDRIFENIEQGNMTPDQEGWIAQALEPQLPDNLKQQLQVSRLTRDKLLQMKQQAQEEAKQAQALNKESLYMSPGQIAKDPRLQSASETGQVFKRSIAKGLTANYAYSPDEDKLQSDNPEIQASERAKTIFYRQQEGTHFVASLAGQITGAMGPMTVATKFLRAGKTAIAAKHLKAGTPIKYIANVLSRSAAPTTTAGNLAEGALVGAGYDISSRPEGSETMNLKEDLQARLQQMGFGIVTGAVGDLLLTKLLPGLLKSGVQLKSLSDLTRNTVKKRRLDKIARKMNYKNFDELVSQHLEIIPDEQGNRVRLKQQSIESLPQQPGTGTKTPPQPRDTLPHAENEPASPATPQQRIAEDQPGIPLGEQPAPHYPEKDETPTGERKQNRQRTDGRTTETLERIVERRTEPVITENTEAPVPHKIDQLETVEAPLDKLILSEDVPQFKSGANKEGIVEPLGGRFDRTGVAPIQVWVRKDGRHEIISGRHRVNLARQTGEKTIPAQYHYESQGFDKQQAAALDALLNIREGQGKVKDYVQYFRNTQPTQAQANADGVLARATGKRAYTIATQGGDTLITAHSADELTDEAATRIAQAAPNNERLQAVGMKAVQEGKPLHVAENMVKAVKSITNKTATSTHDMFGFDDSALKEAEQLARKASAKQADIQRSLSAVQGASKRPDLAAKEGVNVKDPEALKKRIAQLKAEKQAWQNWHTDPVLTAQLKDNIPSTAKQEIPPTKTEKPDDLELTAPTEAELTVRKKRIQETENQRRQTQQAAELKAKADSEAKDFELGIQGSGKDVSSKQGNLLGLAKSRQLPPEEWPLDYNLPKNTKAGGTKEGEPPKVPGATSKEGFPQTSETYQGQFSNKKYNKTINRSPDVPVEPKLKQDLSKNGEKTRISLKSSEKTSATTQTIQAKASKESLEHIPVINNPDPKEKNLKGGPYTLDYHNQLFKTLTDGKLSADNFKEAFSTLVNNKEEVTTRLNKYTKKQLMNMSRRYADKKPQAVDHAFERLIHRFLLDKEAPAFTWEPFGYNKQTYAEAKAAQQKQIADIVNNLSQEDLDRYGQYITEAVEQRKKQTAEKNLKMATPETLEDYHLIVREKGTESLSPAQKESYDQLTAEAQWRAKEKEQPTSLARIKNSDTPLEINPIEKSTHTKTGKTIYNLSLKTRLGKQAFAEAAAQARTMKGGYWKGKFWLPSEKDAKQFMNWLNGQQNPPTARVMEKETAQISKQAEALRAKADKLEESGTKALNQERTTNTPRQMNMAASASEKANEQIKFAQTLRNIANAIEEGSVKFLSRLSDKTQLELLQSIKRRAIPEKFFEEDYNGFRMVRDIKEGLQLTDYIDRVKLPRPFLYREFTVKLIKAMKGKRGFSRTREKLDTLYHAAVRNDERVVNIPNNNEVIQKLDEYGKIFGYDDLGWHFEESIKDLKRLQRMGLTTDEQLRAAIRELETVTSKESASVTQQKKLDELRFKIKQSLKGFNDFFPTPEAPANRVMELADIKTGMKSLEPHGGMGHLAEKIQALAGKDNVDIVEQSQQLADYLKATGHKVTQGDFLKYGEKDIYDRIVMNPPFSKDQDIDHVIHAYDLLKPGGKLVAITSNMAGLRTNKKNRAFSQWLDEADAHVEDLESGSFKSSFNPTSVNTKIIVVNKPVKTNADLRQEQFSSKDISSDQKENNKHPPGTSLYSNPVIPAAREAAKLLKLNPAASFGGAVYGGIAGADQSEAEPFSAKWWLAMATGAGIGATVGSASFHTLKTFPVKGKTVFGKNSYAKQAANFMKSQVRRILGMSRGDTEVIALGKRQKLMKMVIQEQAEQAGKFLLEKFTPAQRAKMADLIEQRGIIAEGNLLHKQAKELDDFIQFTGKKLQELDMLDKDIDLGGYIHRYYDKDLGLSGLVRALQPKGKTLSGTWSKRRGLQEVKDSRYLSPAARELMQKVQKLQADEHPLKNKTGDLLDDETQQQITQIKQQLKDLQATELREYIGPENGKLVSYFMVWDEVPVIPGLKRTVPRKPATAEQIEGLPPTIKEPGSKGNLALTDRRWTVDGMKGNDAILHRDWTTAEREQWGEIHDVAYRLVRGQAEVAHDLSLGTFFKTVYDQLNGKKVSDMAIEGWIKVPDTTVGQSRLKKYGALSGKYVTPDVWKAIKHQGRNPLASLFNNHPAIKTYLSGLGRWKIYKTVYNPVSHMNNVVSNLQMYYLSDHEGKYLAKSFNALRKGDSSVQEAKEAGLFGADWLSSISNIGESYTKDIKELLEKLRTQPEIPDMPQSVEAVMGLKERFIHSLEKTGKFLNKPIKFATDKAKQAYRMEDEFFKMAVYLSARDKGIKPFEAVEEANKFFFDYDDMPTAMKVVRDLPLGSPFISYTYFAIPALVKTAVEKPEKLLALAAALEGFNYAAQAINGDLQKEGYWDRQADENVLLPDWVKGRSLWGGINNLSIPFVESYKLGLANANVGGNPSLGQTKKGEWWPEVLGFWGAGPEGSNPVIKLLFDISNNKDWKGNPIAEEGAPVTEKWRKAINYIYQNLTPSNPLFPGSYSQQKILEGLANNVRQAREAGQEPNMLIESIVDLANASSEALGGTQFTGKDRGGNDILTRDALWGAMGIKLRPITPKQDRRYKVSEINRKNMDKKQWMNRQARDYKENRISKKQYENKLSEYKTSTHHLKKDRKLLESAYKNVVNQ